VTGSSRVPCRRTRSSRCAGCIGNHGLTVALGRPSIAYGEARCVGGGSEVNAGLYHRPDGSVLKEWSDEFDVEGLDSR